MSWAELATARGVALHPSAAETRRFGFPVARLTLGRDAGEVAQVVAGSSADLVVVRWASDDAAVPAALARTGWVLLPAGPIVYWRLRSGSGRRPAAVPGLMVRPAAAVREGGTMEPLVDELVRSVFSGYSSHYSVDPALAPDVVAEGYAEWARSTLLDPGGDAVVLVDGDVPVGVATTAAAEQPAPHVEILLAGVVPQAQGQGRYAHLLAAVEEDAARRGADVVISTQVHNTGVQRAWARYGFEPVGAFETAHLLRPGSPAAAAVTGRAAPR